MTALPKWMRRALVWTAATGVASLAGAAIISLSLFLSPLDPIRVGTPFVMASVLVLYFVVLAVLAWPAAALLSAARSLSARNLIITGALLAGGGNFLMSLAAAEPNTPMVWIVWGVIGALSGAAAGWVLWTLGVSADFKRRGGIMQPTKIEGTDARYRAFFSYARADDGIANWLHGQLDRFRTPKSLIGQPGATGPIPAKLHPIFRDRTDLAAGGHVDEVLDEALKESLALIVLCSPTSAKSHWVNHEVDTFIALGRSDHIFPVIVSGEPDSSDPALECFPPALRGRGHLAADLRQKKLPSGQIVGDGRQDGALKLIAGVLGVDFDQLVRRERRRQQSRAFVLGIAALVAGVLATASTLFAYSSLAALSWSRQNLDGMIEAEFLYLTSLYEREGLAAVERYVQEKPSATAPREAGAASPEQDLSPICLILMDRDGNSVAGYPQASTFPHPSQAPAEGALRFSKELAESFNYEVSPYHLRSDGFLAHLGPEHTLGVATCRLNPPFLYGVFREFFTDAPNVGPYQGPTSRSD